jgi:hypothetical protein
MAMDYNGGNNWHEGSTSAVGNHDFTISAWVNAQNEQNDTVISFYDVNNNTDGHRLEINARTSPTTDRVRAMSEDSALGSNRNNQDYSVEIQNNWVHAAGVWDWDGSTFTARRAFANGINSGTGTGDRAPVDLTNTIVGARLDSDGLGTQFDGYLSHIAIWNVILTDGQILALSKGFSPLRIQRGNLINYWPMGATGTLYDIMQNLNLADNSTANNPTLVEEPPITQFRKGAV